MSVPAQDWETVLAAERCNPEIICWNRFSSKSQLHAYSCIVKSGLLVDIKDTAVGNKAVQPAAIPSFVTGLGDPISIFAYHDDGKCEVLGRIQNRYYAWIFLRGCRESVRV